MSWDDEGWPVSPCGLRLDADAGRHDDFDIVDPPVVHSARVFREFPWERGSWLGPERYAAECPCDARFYLRKTAAEARADLAAHVADPERWTA